MGSRKLVVIYGCGDMGAQVFNILKYLTDVETIGFLDDNLEKKGTKFCGLEIFGNINSLQFLIEEKKITGGIGAIGENKIRYEKNKLIEEHHIEIINAIHPKIFIDDPKSIGNGVIVEMGAYIHSQSTIQDGVFVGSGAILGHGATVCRYSLIAGGVVFGGTAEVGEFSLIGVGSNLQPYVKVGSNVVVGIGSAVTKNIPNNVIAYGVPAKVVRSNRN